jgi:hypothetical protein
MPSRYTHQTRTPRAVHNPIASIPLLRPAHKVLGWTEAQKATFCLTRDRNNLACAEQRYASASAALGCANQHFHARRRLQAEAMRSINAARRLLRKCRASLAASLAAAPAALAS